MTPETWKGFIDSGFDQIHHTVKNIGFDVRQLKDEDAERFFTDFEDKVLAAVATLRLRLGIPYDTKP